MPLALRRIGARLSSRLHKYRRIDSARTARQRRCREDLWVWLSAFVRFTSWDDSIRALRERHFSKLVVDSRPASSSRWSGFGFGFGFGFGVGLG